MISTRVPIGASRSCGARAVVPARRGRLEGGRGSHGVSSAGIASGPAAPAAVQAELDVLRRAAAQPGAVRPTEVLAALGAVEKAKLPSDGWEAALTAPGARWRLVYTVAGKDIVAASRGRKAGTGGYFPISACQKFEDGQGVQNGQFENGVFLGPLGHLTFKGPFQMDGRTMHFDVSTMYLGLGPWRLPIQLKKEDALERMERKAFKKLPFFFYAYVGPDLVVARGRSGGVALWGRADTEWLASSGALSVFK